MLIISQTPLLTPHRPIAFIDDRWRFRVSIFIFFRSLCVFGSQVGFEYKFVGDSDWWRRRRRHTRAQMLIYVCAFDEVTIHAKCDAINNAEDGRMTKKETKMELNWKREQRTQTRQRNTRSREPREEKNTYYFWIREKWVNVCIHIRDL